MGTGVRGKLAAVAATAAILAAGAMKSAAQVPPGPVKLFVDATQVPARALFHARLEIPVEPGPIELYYPEWIPGEHTPTGPIEDLMGLNFTANGQRLRWRRDLVDMFAFHLTIPAGVHELVAELDYVSTAPPSGFSSGASATPHLAVLNWNQVLLYPAGHNFRQIPYDASLRLPAGWQYHTALTVGPSMNAPIDSVHFQTVPLNELIDSPVQMGQYTQVVPLASDPQQEIDIVGDKPEDLALSASLLHAFKQLIAETGALFGSRHYRDYHFLLTLSDYVAHFGLEHHESSDDRSGERLLVDPQEFAADFDLLPHEFTHSWNGKYRRPAGLVDKDYQDPMKDNLLWVYEGLTQYLGQVLAARSGLCAPENCKENLAYVAAGLDHVSGRQWRPLQDAADAAPYLYSAGSQWENYRRGTDFYDEGALVWLEVDTRIRQLTHDQKSIDDFTRLFEGGPGGEPALKTYTFDDVVSALNQVAAFDWAALLRQRLDAVGGGAPLGGLEASGWRLVYNSQPNAQQQAIEAVDRRLDLTCSLGMTVGESGVIRDFVVGMPAYAAGLAPGMRILAVNGQRWSPRAIRDAIRSSARDSAPITVAARDDDLTQTFQIDYHGGLRYPHLERIPGTPDLLDEIYKQHAPPAE
jgi:predicted metalloprotease with PDZ domain